MLFRSDAERVWNPTLARRIRKTFGSFATEFSQKTSADVIAQFDAFTQRWVADNQRACYQTVVRKTMPKSAYVALSACYDAALVQKKAVIAHLIEADPETVANAYDALHEVHRALDACSHAVVYREFAEDVDAKDAAALSRAKSNLAEARVWLATGKVARAFDAALRGGIGIDAPELHQTQPSSVSTMPALPRPDSDGLVMK